MVKEFYTLSSHLTKVKKTLTTAVTIWLEYQNDIILLNVHETYLKIN